VGKGWGGGGDGGGWGGGGGVGGWGGLHEKHVVAFWIFGNHLSICFQDTGKPRKKTCIEAVGRRTFRTLTSSQRSGIMYRLHGKLSWPQSWAVVLCVCFFFTCN
jgi:hypothetical protein